MPRARPSGLRGFAIGLAASVLFSSIPVGPPRAHARHDGEPSPATVKAIAEFAGACNALGREATAEAMLAAARRYLGALPSADLHHLEDGERVLTDPTRLASYRLACRAWCFVAEHGKRLDDADPIAVGLADEEPRARAAAFVRLSHEPFGPKLATVLGSLSRDRRPDVRAGAGVIAGLQSDFLGPSEATDAILGNLVADASPVVAVGIAWLHGWSSRSAAVCRRIDSRRGDDRRVGEMDSLPWMLTAPQGRVGDSMTRILVGRSCAALEAAGVNEGVLPFALRDDPKRALEWWDATPHKVPKDADAFGWVRRLDTTLVLAPGEVVPVVPVGGGAPWEFALREFREEESVHGPLTGATIALTRPGTDREPFLVLGSRHHPLGSGYRHNGNDGILHQNFAPEGRSKRVRVRLRYWEAPAGR